MRIIKMIFTILALLCGTAAVVIVMMFNCGTLTGFWVNMGRIVMFGAGAALCIFVVKCADDAEEVIEGRKKLQEDLKENAPATANSKRA